MYNDYDAETTDENRFESKSYIFLLASVYLFSNHRLFIYIYQCMHHVIHIVSVFISFVNKYEQ